jgi:hypothetical protein
VVIDEAQSLSPTLLDEVRMLTAFELDGRRLIQIVLCGQPMLLNTLKTEPMYALNERITRRVALTPLSPAEVESYIYHRLAIAGSADAVSFQSDAMKLIAELSHGLPARVNVLCDRTLQEGRAVSATTITSDLVKRRPSRSPAHIRRRPERRDRGSARRRQTIAIAAERHTNRFARCRHRCVGARRAGHRGYVYFGGSCSPAEPVHVAGQAVHPQGTPPPPLTIPTDAELEAWFREMRVTGRRGLIPVPRRSPLTRPTHHRASERA